MAEPVTVARPYAEAVFKLAREEASLESWSRALELLEHVTQEPAVSAVIGDPNVSAEDIEKLIFGVLGEELPGPARNLVQVLLGNGRLELVPEVRALYEALRREHESVIEVNIISAFPLAEEQVSELVTRLGASHQRRVQAKVVVDPTLIGGVRIEVGDKVIDATVRGRLDAMAAALAH